MREKIVELLSPLSLSPFSSRLLGKMRRALPIILVLIGSVAECLELYRVEVPHSKQVGEVAELQCKFHLGRDRLYAVKWYKDNSEFFRYIPRFNPSIHTHSLPGVHVDTSRSTQQVVFLKNLGVRSGGVYKCEISAEAPSFSSFSGEGRMTVVYLPKDGPQIVGKLLDSYDVGDTLDLNCTSARSFPPAKISWYINELPIMGHTEFPYYDNAMELQPPSLGATVNNGKYSSASANNLNTNLNNNNGHNLIRSSTRRLQLQLAPNHFSDKGTAKIRCVARIFPLFWQDGDEKRIDHKNSSSSSTKGNKSSAHNTNNQHHTSFNEVDDGPGVTFQQPFHERLGSLYNGEALVQIRGGCGTLSKETLPFSLLLILLVVLSH